MFSDTSSSIIQKHDLQVGQRCAVRSFFSPAYTQEIRLINFYVDFSCKSLTAHNNNNANVNTISSKGTQRQQPIGRIVKSICR